MRQEKEKSTGGNERSPAVDELYLARQEETQAESEDRFKSQLGSDISCLAFSIKAKGKHTVIFKL